MRESQLIQQMHWDITKLLSLGVDEKFLINSNISPDEARDLVKGLLYLRERYKEEQEKQVESITNRV